MCPGDLGGRPTSVSLSSASLRRRLRALILQHVEPTPAGHVTEWLAEQDAEVDTYRIDLEQREVDPSDYDLIVSLGSEYAAFDDTSRSFSARPSS